jgi:ribosome-associated toxin RatA of RatAB toxin-antitoxin module
MDGTATETISAPIEVCYDIAADVDRIAEWQTGVKHVEVIERDAQGRPLVVQITNDAKVRDIKTTVRFEYNRPHGLSWRQIKGDLKSLVGHWRFEHRDGATHATYELQGDPGFALGMLVRGPVESRLRELLVHARPRELKAQAETA